jgi:hypothetical protein
MIPNHIALGLAAVVCAGVIFADARSSVVSSEGTGARVMGANNEDLTNMLALLHAGCRDDEGIPAFFDAKPDRQEIADDPDAGKIYGLFYGPHVVTGTRKDGKLIVHGVLIRKQDPPAPLREVFTLTRDQLIKRLGEPAEESPEAIQYGFIDDAILTIFFDQDKVDRLDWSCGS